MFKNSKFIFLCMLMFVSSVYADTKTAPTSWLFPIVSKIVTENVLYFPIMHESVKNIPIQESEEDLVDLLEVDNQRIKPLSGFNSKYENTYEGYSKVRRGVYNKLVEMLEILPK